MRERVQKMHNHFQRRYNEKQWKVGEKGKLWKGYQTMRIIKRKEVLGIDCKLLTLLVSKVAIKIL